jgi:hypothetical protein
MDLNYILLPVEAGRAEQVSRNQSRKLIAIVANLESHRLSAGANLHKDPRIVL